MKRLLLAALLSGVPPTAAAGEFTGPTLSVGGLLFGDLYVVPSHHLPEGDGAAGLVLRRGYLTFNGQFTPNWFGRLRFELNQSGEFETYDFSADFKDLYFGWNIGRQVLIAGLAPTPTFDLIESIWGFRYLARTPMDLHGVPSRDNGFSLKGPLNASGSISYRAMVGFEFDFGRESDDGRRWMAALNWKPAPNWILDLYTDHELRDGPFDRTTWQVFAAYQRDGFAWGAQYSHQDREADPDLELASSFIRGEVSRRVQLVGRVDRLFEPAPRGNSIAYLPFDPSAKATTLFAGVEFQATPHFAVTPNVVVTRYDRNEEGVRPKTDLYLRLTLFIDFE